MKLGVLTASLSSMSLEEVLIYLNGLGIQAVELGAGGYPGTSHLNPEILLNNEGEINKVKALLEKYDMIISAISVHGNPIHPQKEVADKFHRDFENAVLLAERLGIDRVITFSGCPGDSATSKYPNWVTCPWPDDFLEILNWQWNEVLIPYWKKEAEFCKAHNVNKICFEMHPGFCVYNPETLLKLRNAVGDIIGANFDPSHLFWQGIDPVLAIRKIGTAIYHFHAKDTRIDMANTIVNGVLDTKHYTDELNRSWVFRTIGYGHNEQVWRDIVSELRLAGYDHVISIEHEDSLMTPREGLEKAISFLKGNMIFEPKPTDIFWA